MVNNEENKVYRYKIRLDTYTDVTTFISIVSNYDAKITLTDGKGYTVNAKSILAVLYTMEWNDLYIESSVDIYNSIKTFVI